MVSTHLAVLGSPIAHSKSPLIHAAAYQVLGLEWDYGRFDLSEDQLPGFLALRDSSWRGLSLTMPLKEAGVRASVALSGAAARTGAVNTLLNAERGWLGFNTDVFGVEKALSEAGVTNVQRAAVVGSGATARSAVVALVQAFPDVDLTMHARSAARAEELLELLQVRAQIKPIAELGDYEVTVSTLPKAQFMPEEQQAGCLLDVAYDPWPSNASKLYESTVSGLEMLLWQALAQIRIFTSGSEHEPLDNEREVLSAMRSAL